MKPLHRRTFLRGMAGTAIALPWLEAMGIPKAQAAPGVSATGFPKRYLQWTTHNGFHPPIWNPSGGETDFVMRPVHASLEPFKKDLVIVAGLDNAAWYSPAGKGDTHSRGMCTFLSGTESIVDLGTNLTNGGESKSSGGITVDQEIVKQLAPKTKFSSLEMNFMVGGGAYSTSSYLGANKPLPGARDPSVIFNRIFAGGTGGGATADPAAAARIVTERRSILDAVGKTYQGLSPKLGLADRDKIDSHLTQIRDLEMRLQVMAPIPGPSPTPAAGGAPAGSTGCPKDVKDPAAGTDRVAQANALTDLMATAIICDLTRVGTLQWDMTTGNTVYSWLGISRGHHDMSHDGDEVGGTVADLTKIHTFYTQHLAQLVTRLKGVQEGNGTLLDNTLILHACDMARGNNGHTGRGLYHMLLGHAGGPLKGGRLLRYSGDANNKLFVSILNMFDIPANTFGNPALSSGPLARL